MTRRNDVGKAFRRALPNRTPSLSPAAGRHLLLQHPNVVSLLRKSVVQANLPVGPSDNPNAPEADRVAKPVMSGPTSNVGVQLNDAQRAAEGHPPLRPTEGQEADEQAKPKSGGPVPAAASVEQQIYHIRQGGVPLPESTRTFFEARFGAGFGAVRVHSDRAAAKTAETIGARAYTIGNHVVFGRGAYKPFTRQGDQLIAHELTHVLQQSEPGRDHTIQRQPASQSSDPNRFAAVHQNLFIDAPGTGLATRQPWGTNTTDQIIQRFKTTLQQNIDNNPLSVLGNLPSNTSEASAESTAIQVNSRIRTMYPQIGVALSEQHLRSSVSLLTPTQTTNPDFIKQWLANRLFRVTNIGNFAADETDANFQAVVQSLANDQAAFDFTNALNTLSTILSNRPRWSRQDVAIVVAQERQRVAGFTWSDVINVLASRTGAFVETSQTGREVFLSPGLDTAARTLTLIHELTHFYVHDQFTAWLDTTTAPRFYNEGFTEYLARQVMTPQQVQNRDTYQDRVDAIAQEVAPYVSLDDIARAYFAGEVWRIEAQSPVAQRLFGEQTGLHADAKRRTEVTESASSKGIVQTVVTGSHWRFMNLAVDDHQPKPEHEAALRQILTDHVLNHASARVRFVGHTSTIGSASHNLNLARRRARAFYELARRLGVSETQLIDATNPATSGEAQVNVAESNQVIHRALNRRVELFIQ